MLFPRTVAAKSKMLPPPASLNQQQQKGLMTNPEGFYKT